MPTTPNLGLALIEEAQTQKHITANETATMLDLAYQLTVLDRDLTAPPTSPADGDRYFVAAAATGDWAGEDGAIAAFSNGGWVFNPQAGWRMWVADEAVFLVYNGTAWSEIDGGGADLSSITQLGVNASPDATNRLTVKSNAVLLSHDDVTPGSGDIRLTLNKIDASHTGSLLFQTNWTGKAEMGLTGSNAFAIKVASASGFWRDALTVDPETGVIDMPHTTQEAPTQAAQFGVNMSAGLINRLSVKANGALFTHDNVTPGSGDMVLTVNKAAAARDAIMRFNVNGEPRAELGLGGDEDLSLAVTADNSAWRDAFTVDRGTGVVTFPNGMRDGTADFGDSPPVTTDYITARGVDLVANGTGLLGNNYNYPANFTYDPINTPGLPAAFAFAGYHAGVETMEETIAVDPNQAYRLAMYLRQEPLAGDWSAHPYNEKHLQYAGLLCYDSDNHEIQAHHHMRHRHNDVDSLTTLTATLTPGDTTISVADASGWSEAAQSYRRGVIIFEYKNSQGFLYEFYSRLVAFDLFNQGDVNKSTNVVTLKVPFPASLGNPDDPNGTWPIGTRIANSDSGGSYKYSLLSTYIPPTQHWVRVMDYMGGIDVSGKNITENFPPGTAEVRMFWLPNYSNRAGGWSSYPDTGAAHRVWFTGVSVIPDPVARLETAADGSKILKVPTADPSTGALSLQTAAFSAQEV